MANELTRQFLRPDHCPSVEQIEEYRELMIGIIHAMHRGIKMTARFPGSEFMLPDTFTEWSEPDSDGHVCFERARNYSASYKHIGMGAHKLTVTESDTVLLPDHKRYATQRQQYRFAWDHHTVYDSQALHTEVISDAVSAVAMLSFDNRQVSISEIDEHAEPFRYSEHRLVNDSDVDCLLERTERYSNAYLAHLHGYAYDELASQPRF